MATEAVKNAGEQAPVAWDNIFSVLKQIIELTSSDNLGRFVSAVGIVILFFCGGVAYKLIKANPRSVMLWHKLLVFVPGTLGMLFVVAGPALSLYQKGLNSEIIYRSRAEQLENFFKNDVRPETILENLKDNKRVSRFIRLIAYDPAERPELSLERISYIGPLNQRYSFVADYDELRGYTGAEALRKTGIRYVDGLKISAVIFSADQVKDIIPMNARGLMQVINTVETGSQLKPLFDVNGKLSNIWPAAVDGLKDGERLESWSWPEYRRFYKEYCSLSYEFRCNSEKYPAATLIGTLTHDWHPLGFARHASRGGSTCSDENLKRLSCELSEWPSDAEFLKSVGTRAFMIPNVPISSLKGRILIDFSNPTVQKIPSLLPDGISPNEFFSATPVASQQDK